MKNKIDILKFIFNPSSYYEYEECENHYEIFKILSDNQEDDTVHQKNYNTFKMAINALKKHFNNNIRIFVPYSEYKDNDLYIIVDNKKYLVEVKQRKRQYNSYLLEYNKLMRLLITKTEEEADDILYLNVFEDNTYVLFSLNMVLYTMQNEKYIPDYVDSNSIVVKEIRYFKNNYSCDMYELENFKHQLLRCNFKTNKHTYYSTYDTIKDCIFIPKSLDLKNIVYDK